MVFNNDCQYYSTLQNSVDKLSFSNLIKNLSGTVYIEDITRRRKDMNLIFEW